MSNYSWGWLFQGREYQPTLGNYDFRARSLWPALGRFGSEDPAGSSPTVSLYQGLQGAWQENVDPSGLYEVDVHHYLTTFLASQAGFSSRGSLAGGLTGRARSDGGLADEIGLQTQEPDMDARVAGWGLFRGKENRTYHFVPLSVLDSQFALLPLHVLLEPAEPQTWRSTGEYLHGLQDSYSHQRDPVKRDPSQAYGSSFFGHGLQYHYPDWTFERPPLAMAMAKETYEKICGLYRSLAGKATARTRDWTTIQADVQRFVEYIPTEFFLEGGYVLAVRDYQPKIQILNDDFHLTMREREKQNGDWLGYDGMVTHLLQWRRPATYVPPGNNRTPGRKPWWE